MDTYTGSKACHDPAARFAPTAKWQASKGSTAAPIRQAESVALFLHRDPLDLDQRPRVGTAHLNGGACRLFWRGGGVGRWQARHRLCAGGQREGANSQSHSQDSKFLRTGHVVLSLWIGKYVSIGSTITLSLCARSFSDRSRQYRPPPRSTWPPPR